MLIQQDVFTVIGYSLSFSREIICWHQAKSRVVACICAISIQHPCHSASMLTQ